MKTRSIRGKLFAASAVTLAVTLALTGCGKSSKTDTTNTPTPGASESGTGTAADMVPAALKSKGTLTVATDASYAPNEFFDADGTTIIGMDVDLGNAIAEKLGLKVKFENVGFDSILAGLAGGKYDLGMSSFTDTKEREGTVDFVTYFNAGTSVMVAKGNPQGITGPDDLCGRKVAIETGTTQELNDIPAKTKACEAAGKKAVIPVALPDQNAAQLAVTSGRADATLADSPVGEYEAKQPGAQFEVAGKSYDDAPYGIAIPKDVGTLKDAILAAIKELIADGSYQKILDKWEIGDGAITNPVINGATS